MATVLEKAVKGNIASDFLAVVDEIQAVRNWMGGASSKDAIDWITTHIREYEVGFQNRFMKVKRSMEGK